jgi:enoyl-CoA hydratase/carnithine racemase
LSERIIVQANDHIAKVILAGSAISERMAFELRDACDQVDQDDAVWVAVITGKGEAFCLGSRGEIESSGEPFDPAQGSLVEPTRPYTTNDTLLQAMRSLKVAGRVAAVQKPLVAALNGDAIDQGLELALACDIRIASSQSRLGLTQVKDGLLPWDGGTQRLPRLIGRGRAIEMVLTSRIVSAQEALSIGLVNQVVGPDKALERSLEIASAIASHGPIAARYLKEAVLKGMDLTLEQGLRLEADLNFILQNTADRAEGIRSFLERRRPQYRGE